jgi:hypothetical protein
VGDLTISVGVVVLGQVNPTVGVSEAHRNNEMESTTEAPAVDHVRVLRHVNAIIHGEAILGNGERKVLGESFFYLSAARGV